jgi:hypothetical protein
MSRGGAVAAFQVHVAGSQERAVRHKDLTVFQVAKSRTGDTRLVCCGQERLGRSAERVGLGGAARGGESCGLVERELRGYGSWAYAVGDATRSLDV